MSVKKYLAVLLCVGALLLMTWIPSFAKENEVPAAAEAEVTVVEASAQASADEVAAELSAEQLTLGENESTKELVLPKTVTVDGEECDTVVTVGRQDTELTTSSENRKIDPAKTLLGVRSRDRSCFRPTRSVRSSGLSPVLLPV